MKRILYRLLLSIIVIGAIVACSKDDSTDNIILQDVPITEVVSGSAALADMPQNGGFSEFTISADDAWEMIFPEGSENWITLLSVADGGSVDISAPVLGEGRMSFRVELGANISRESRYADITIKTSRGLSTLAINQASVIYGELLYLSMGSDDSVESTDDMPLEGVGTGDITRDDIMAEPANAFNFQQTEGLCSTSIAGIYSASGGNYMQISAGGELLISKIKSNAKNINLNLGCSVIGVTAGEAFDKTQLQLSYYYDDDIAGAATIQEFEVAQGAGIWSYILAEIPKPSSSDASYITIKVKATAITENGRGILIDDLSMFEDIEAKPISNIEINDIRDTKMLLEGNWIGVDGEAASTEDVKNYGFRWMQKDAEDATWTEQKIADDFKFLASNLLANTTYLCQSFVELASGEVIRSFTIERTTTSTPIIEIDESKTVGTGKDKISVTVNIYAMLGGEKTPIQASSIAEYGVQYRLSGSSDEFISPSSQVSELLISENATSYTQELTALSEGTSYEIIGAVKYSGDTSASVSESVDIATALGAFDMGVIRSEGSLKAENANEEGITLIVPIKQPSAAVAWLDLNTDSEHLLVTKEVADNSGSDRQTYPKVIKINVSGPIAELPPYSVINCTLIRRDAPDVPQNLRVAVYDATGTVNLHWNSEKFIAEKADLGADLPSVSPVEPFNTLSFSNSSGLTIKRFSANEAYNTTEGLIIDKSFGFSAMRDATGSYLISNSTNPEEGILFSFDMPYGIDFSTSSGQIQILSKIRPSAVIPSPGFKWIYAMSIPSIDNTWYEAVGSDVYIENSNPAAFAPSDAKDITLMANRMENYRPKYAIPANLTRSDNHKMTFRLAPNSFNHTTSLQKNHQFAEFTVMLTTSSPIPLAPMVSVSAELDESKPSSIINMKGSYKNTTSVVDSGFKIMDNSGTTIEEKWLGINTQEFEYTYSAAESDTEYKIVSVIKLADNSIVESLLSQKIRTAIYIPPTSPTAMISSEPISLTSYSIEVEVEYTNVANNNLTPVVEYRKMGDMNYTSLEGLPALLVDGAMTYELEVLDADADYEVRAALKTQDGATYPYATANFRTNAEPTAEFGEITAAENSATFDINITNKEDIRRFQLQYKNASSSSWTTVWFNEVGEPLSDNYPAYVLDGLDAGTEYIVKWNIVYNKPGTRTDGFTNINGPETTFTTSTISSPTAMLGDVTADETTITLNGSFVIAGESGFKAGYAYKKSVDADFTFVTDASALTEDVNDKEYTISALKTGSEYTLMVYLEKEDGSRLTSDTKTITLSAAPIVTDLVTITKIVASAEKIIITLSCNVDEADKPNNFKWGVEILPGIGESNKTEYLASSTAVSRNVNLNGTTAGATYAIKAKWSPDESATPTAPTISITTPAAGEAAVTTEYNPDGSIK